MKEEAEAGRRIALNKMEACGSEIITTAFPIVVRHLHLSLHIDVCGTSSWSN
jgi:hypothetical protein